MVEKALPGEELYYIGVQHLPALSITAAVRLTMPKSIVVTSHRFVIVEPKLVGDTEMEEFVRGDVESAVRRIKANSRCGTFSLVLRNGEWIELNKIPAAQLKRLEELSRYILSH